MLPSSAPVFLHSLSCPPVLASPSSSFLLSAPAPPPSCLQSCPCRFPAADLPSSLSLPSVLPSSAPLFLHSFSCPPFFVLPAPAPPPPSSGLQSCPCRAPAADPPSSHSPLSLPSSAPLFLHPFSCPPASPSWPSFPFSRLFRFRNSPFSFLLSGPASPPPSSAP